MTASLHQPALRPGVHPSAKASAPHLSASRGERKDLLPVPCFSSVILSLSVQLVHLLPCRLLGPSSPRVSCGHLVRPTAGTRKAYSAAAARTQLNYNAWPGQRHPELQNTSIIPQRDAQHDRDSSLDFLSEIKIAPVLGKGRRFK